MWQETLKVKVGARKYISCLVISTEKPQRLFALFKGGFSFFSQGGWWKNFRWGASHTQYAILDALEGA